MDKLKIHELFKNTNIESELSRLYGKDNLDKELTRYASLVKKHKTIFNCKGQLFLVSAPGRIELSGNHTDHNKGKVLAAAINRDALACVSKRDDNTINLYSDGYDPITVHIDNLNLNKNEYNTTIALIKGIASKMHELGYKIGGFDACINSTVLSGSGLSSSAAVEILLVSIFDTLYNNNDMPNILKAKVGQYAENVYFGKPSGLLDQSASAIGGVVYIDFMNDDPYIEPISLDLTKYGYRIIVVNTNSRHDNLTPAYASIPKEMKSVANFFGKETLSEVPFNSFLDNIKAIRGKLGERPLLRAIHFFNENNRVEHIIKSIKNDNINSLFYNIIDSGRSSFMYLQNIYAEESYQPMSLALALSEQLLNGYGAWRIHGGGFAGTTLNIVPNDLVPRFKDIFNAVFGEEACIELNIRPQGSSFIKL